MVAENESCFSYYSNLLHAKQIENKSRMHTETRIALLSHIKQKSRSDTFTA